MERDLIFVFFGGAMDGVFGGGVATSLQKLNLYPRIHSMYGMSAGAHNIAYFLAKDSELGSSVYYEDLIGDRFIKKKRSRFLLTLLRHTFDSRKRLETLMDLDYLIEIEKNKKRLNLEKIQKSDIGFFIRAFNMDSQCEEYLDGKTDTLKKLHAASVVLPFYPELISVNNIPYADSDTLSRVIDPYLEKLILENPDKKIIFVFNYPMKSIGSLKMTLDNFFWTLLLLLYFRKRFLWKKCNLPSEYRKLVRYSRMPNVLTIDPDIYVPMHCTDRERLLELYTHGVEKTKKILAQEGIVLL